MIHAFTDNSKATWNDYIVPDLGNCPQTNRPRLHDELVCVTETDRDRQGQGERKRGGGGDGVVFLFNEKRMISLHNNEHR